MEYWQHLDQNLFLFLNNLGNPTWDWFWLFVTYKWAWIPLYGFLIWLVYKKTGLKLTCMTLILIALMITCTDQFSNFVKHGVSRLRPCNMGYDARFLVLPCGSYGFFSAHAASSMALAIFVGMVLKPYYKYALRIMIIWALFVGYSRIYVGKHYPGDVMAGWLIGLLIGVLFCIFRYYLLKMHALRKLQQAHLSSNK